MASTPNYAVTPKLTTVQVSTANTNRDGSTGTYSAEITIGSNGALLDHIQMQATVTTTAGLIRIFYAADGSTYRLLGEQTTAAATVSGTVPGDKQTWVPPGGVPMNLTGGSKLKFNVNNSETWNIHVQLNEY